MSTEIKNPRGVRFTQTSTHTISTVLLTSGDAFETLVFDEQGREEDELTTTSRLQAVLNHERMVSKYQQQ